MADEEVDARGMAPGERSDVIRDAFKELGSGEELGVVSDIDPHPIYYELRNEFSIDEDASEIEERGGGLFAAWFVKD